MYQPKPDGLSGNDDCGQMSAWYIFSALGFYPVAPASPNYAIGSPLVTKATIKLENGKTLTISTQNQAKNNVYVQKVLLNGKPYNSYFLNHNDIVSGGEITFIMGDKPKKLK